MVAQHQTGIAKSTSAQSHVVRGPRPPVPVPFEWNAANQPPGAREEAVLSGLKLWKESHGGAFPVQETKTRRLLDAMRRLFGDSPSGCPKAFPRHSEGLSASLDRHHGYFADNGFVLTKTRGRSAPGAALHTNISWLFGDHKKVSLSIVDDIEEERAATRELSQLRPATCGEPTKATMEAPPTPAPTPVAAVPPPVAAVPPRPAMPPPKPLKPAAPLAPSARLAALTDIAAMVRELVESGRTEEARLLQRLPTA